jgi:hypothetical protein
MSPTDNSEPGISCTYPSIVWGAIMPDEFFRSLSSLGKVGFSKADELGTVFDG